MRALTSAMIAAAGLGTAAAVALVGHPQAPSAPPPAANRPAGSAEKAPARVVVTVRREGAGKPPAARGPKHARGNGRGKAEGRGKGRDR